MHVIDDLRVPHVVQLADGGARLRLRKDIPVAIIVVPHVALPQLRRRRTFERRAQRLAIPLGHDIDAVRIQRRHQQHDVILQNGPEARRILRDQPVRKLHGAVSRRHFGGVNGASDQHHILAAADELLGLRGGGDARIGQAPLLFPVAIEMAQRVGRRDGRDNQWPPVDALAVLVNADLVARLRQRVEVSRDPGPVQQLAIRPHAVTEVRFRRGDGGPGREAAQQQLSAESHSRTQSSVAAQTHSSSAASRSSISRGL